MSLLLRQISLTYDNPPPRAKQQDYWPGSFAKSLLRRRKPADGGKKKTSLLIFNFYRNKLDLTMIFSNKGLAFQGRCGCVFNFIRKFELFCGSSRCIGWRGREEKGLKKAVFARGTRDRLFSGGVTEWQENGSGPGRHSWRYGCWCAPAGRRTGRIMARCPRGGGRQLC